MTTKDKAEEIAIRVIGDDRNYHPLVDLLIEMAEWKDKQCEKYFDSVLSIKFLYFLNEKEKRENTVIDNMDWKKTVCEFTNYLKQ